MSKYYLIDGYWKDDRTSFYGYIVKEFDDSEENEEDDDKIFFYGLGEKELKEAIELKENTMHDFVITNFKEIKNPIV